MNKIAIVAVITATFSLFQTGCTSIHERAETNGTNRVTVVRINTLFDAKQVVDKVKASNGTTHSLGAAGVQQESDSKVVETAVRAAVEAAIGVPKK